MLLTYGLHVTYPLWERCIAIGGSLAVVYEIRATLRCWMRKHKLI